MKKIIISLMTLLLLVSCVSLEREIADCVLIMAEVYEEGDTKDTWNLRADADFEVEVYDGVWWVPASSLGSSRYTNKLIASVVSTSPQVKKAVIGNLYEAVQLYQIGDFSSDTDEDSMNVRAYDSDSGYSWEKHARVITPFS